MKLIPILLIVFGIILIAFPEFLAYLIGGFFVIVGVNILLISTAFSSKMKDGKDDYIKFGKYKIYR